MSGKGGRGGLQGGVCTKGWRAVPGDPWSIVRGLQIQTARLPLPSSPTEGAVPLFLRATNRILEKWITLPQSQAFRSRAPPHTVWSTLSQTLWGTVDGLINGVLGMPLCEASHPLSALREEGRCAPSPLPPLDFQHPYCHHIVCHKIWAPSASDMTLPGDPVTVSSIYDLSNPTKEVALLWGGEFSLISHV